MLQRRKHAFFGFVANLDGVEVVLVSGLETLI